MHDILIGNMVMANTFYEIIDRLANDGFESIHLNMRTPEELALVEKEGAQMVEKIQALGMRLSSLAFYGNPLADEEHRERYARIIRLAETLQCDLVAGFAGALPGESIDVAMPMFKKVFDTLGRQAADAGVRFAFENCEMGGSWRHATTNIAINPSAWEKMFNEVPLENLGLEWEPAHQLYQLIDPLPQLRKYAKKVFHLHGKDGNVDRTAVQRYGILSPEAYFAHRFPGMGDTNWSSILTILRNQGYRGYIDIEGWHDPIYRGALEYDGQKYALRYLKNCRDGSIQGREVRS